MCLLTVILTACDMLSHYTPFLISLLKRCTVDSDVSGHASVWTCASLPVFTFARYGVITGPENNSDGKSHLGHSKR